MTTKRLAVLAVLIVLTVRVAAAQSPDLARAAAWRPIREGIRVTAGEEAVTASYKVVTGQPAGAALMIPPGTLAGLETLKLRVRGNRNSQLIVSLRDAAGVVYAFPAVPMRVGAAREVEVSVADLTYPAPQSSVPDPGSFDLAKTVMITLLDISGFMGTETPDVEWTVESLRGVTR